MRDWKRWPTGVTPCPVYVLTQGRKAAKPQGYGNWEGETVTENEIATVVVDAAYCIHKHFGPGLHETVYEVSLVSERAA